MFLLCLSFICTVEPWLKTTLIRRPPCYKDHFQRSPFSLSFLLLEREVQLLSPWYKDHLAIKTTLAAAQMWSLYQGSTVHATDSFLVWAIIESLFTKGCDINEDVAAGYNKPEHVASSHWNFLVWTKAMVSWSLAWRICSGAFWAVGWSGKMKLKKI